MEQRDSRDRENPSWTFQRLLFPKTLTHFCSTPASQNNRKLQEIPILHEVIMRPYTTHLAQILFLTYQAQILLSFSHRIVEYTWRIFKLYPTTLYSTEQLPCTFKHANKYQPIKDCPPNKNHPPKPLYYLTQKYRWIKITCL